MTSITYISATIITFLLLRFFYQNPKRKIKSQLDSLYVEVLHLQRNGKLREYGEKMKKIKELEKQL